MVFNALSLNVDDHAKNFEFMMDRLGQWRLTPAYDVTYSKGVVKEHLTTINGKSSQFALDDFLSVAKKNLIDEKEAKKIIDAIAKKLSTYEQRAIQVGISILESTKIGFEIQSQLIYMKLI